MTVRTVELACGAVEYEDNTGGENPVVVFLHGLLMDGSLWDEVVGDLSADFRCVVPTLPLGAHRRAARPGADLSLPAQARLVLELLERLNLQDVTLVGNDTGGALVQLIAGGDAPRVGRIVLVSCEAFDNFPPPMVKPLLLAGRLPARFFGIFMQQMRIKALRRLPIAFGWLTKRGDATTARWVKPILGRAEIRRDAVRVLRALGTDRNLLVRAAEKLEGFDRPALVIWAAEDRIMPPEHAHRLADLLPRVHAVEVEDSYTLVPLDQPAWLAGTVRTFHQEVSYAGAR